MGIPIKTSKEHKSKLKIELKARIQRQKTIDNRGIIRCFKDLFFSWIRIFKRAAEQAR